MGKTITYSYEPGYFFGQNQKIQDRNFKDAFKEVSDCCGATWVRTLSRGEVHHDWDTEENMKALGLYYKREKRTTLNLTREMGLERPDASYRSLRIPIATIHHESIGHYLRWPHVPPDDTSSIMNEWASVRFLTPLDVIRLQDRFGLPSKEFYPPELVYYGNIIRNAKKERARLIPIRNADPIPSSRFMTHEKILDQVDSERRAGQEWLRVHKVWKDVPFAGPK